MFALISLVLFILDSSGVFGSNATTCPTLKKIAMQCPAGQDCTSVDLPCQYFEIQVKGMDVCNTAPIFNLSLFKTKLLDMLNDFCRKNHTLCCGAPSSPMHNSTNDTYFAESQLLIGYKDSTLLKIVANSSVNIVNDACMSRPAQSVTSTQRSSLLPDKITHSTTSSMTSGVFIKTTTSRVEINSKQNEVKISPVVTDQTKPKLTTNEVTMGTSSITTEVITSSSKNEVITSSNKNEVIISSNSNEVVTSSSKNEVMTSSNSNEVVTSSSKNEVITSSSKNEVITSSSKNEVMTSLNSNEVVTSLSKNEVMTSLNSNEVVTSSNSNESTEGTGDEKEKGESNEKENESNEKNNDSEKRKRRDVFVQWKYMMEQLTSHQRNKRSTTTSKFVILKNFFQTADLKQLLTNSLVNKELNMTANILEMICAKPSSSAKLSSFNIYCLMIVTFFCAFLCA